MKQHLAFIFLIILLIFGLNRQAFSQYPFIRYDLNRIILPEDSSSWFDFAKKLNTAKEKGNLKILHFGDSHIQGDYFTGQVRKHLFNYLEIKSRSRGITLPYSVAGTNGPDELFSTSQGCIDISSIRKGASNYYALTGYCISACDSHFTINLKDTSKYSFNRVYIFHSPLKLQKIKLNGAEPFSTINLSDSLQISVFELPQQNVLLNLQVLHSTLKNKSSLYGFSLENTENNIIYHSVGINGATFGTFLNLQDSEELIQFLEPDCVILSYGTNDALNRNLDAEQLKKQIISCINIIKSALPNVPVILSTPGDYLLNKHQVNPRTAAVVKIIKETAFENNCAIWDFYNVMGGAGSVRDWYKDQLVFKDWVHLSKKGYRFQGDLFFTALLKLKDIHNN